MHQHHPVETAGPSTTAGEVRTSELLGALSTALDLTEGLLEGHSSRGVVA